MSIYKVWILVALMMAACAHQKTVHRPMAPVEGSATSGVYSAEGLASWYGRAWNGRKTASGKRFRHTKLTAAHRTLPFGTKVLVTNLANDKVVEVVINDRGPAIKSREIDLSHAAAKKLGFVGAGVTKVRIEALN